MITEINNNSWPLFRLAVNPLRLLDQLIDWLLISLKRSILSPTPQCSGRPRLWNNLKIREQKNNVIGIKDLMVLLLHYEWCSRAKAYNRKIVWRLLISRSTKKDLYLFLRLKKLKYIKYLPFILELFWEFFFFCSYVNV